MVFGILNNEWWGVLLVLCISFSVAVMAFIFTDASKKQFLKAKETESYKLILRGLKEHTIMADEDIRPIYKSIDKKI